MQEHETDESKTVVDAKKELPEHVPDTIGRPRTEGSLSRDEIFTALSNQRRRIVIGYLKWTDGGKASMRELYRHVAATENDVGLEETTYDQRKSAQVSLHQTHLPKLDELDVVEYDQNDGSVSLGEEFQELEFYLELNRSPGLLWSDYYIGLSVLGGLLAVALAYSVWPFILISNLGWLAIVVGLFFVSSVAHAFVTRQSRLGTGRWISQRKRD